MVKSFFPDSSIDRSQISNQEPIERTTPSDVNSTIHSLADLNQERLHQAI